MKKLNQILLFFVLAGVSACSSLKTKEKNEAEITKIKKVALIAFTLNRPAPRKLGFDLGSKSLTGSDGGSILVQESTETNQVMNQVLLSLHKQLNWQVMETSLMTKHPAYQAAYKATMEGWQNKMPPGAGIKQFGVKAVMDVNCPRILRPEGRAKLMRELGVDAIAVAQVDVHLNGTSIMGIGEQYPQSTVLLHVYSLNQENPIWFESFAGAESKISVGKTAFFDEEKLAKLSIDSTADALKKITK